MTCEAAVAALSDYLDGLLSEADRGAVEAHLADCHDCHLVLDTTQCTILLYRASRSTSLAGDRRARFLRRIEQVCGCCGSRQEPDRA